MKKTKGNKILNNPPLTEHRVEDTFVPYSKQSTRLTISTLAEQEQSNYLYWLDLTPSQRIANVTALIRKIYAIQLSLPSKTERIIFDKL